MYRVFEQLLQQNGVTSYKVAKEAGVTQTALSNWKSGRSTPTTKTLQKIADYFDVSIDYLMTGKKNFNNTEDILNPKDEKDIAKRLEKTLSDLENTQEALMFSGELLDDETRELLKASLENSIRIAKINAKQKFTPKKYKTDKK
ncbi:MAG: helix-turn-helix transcriptional regulator [Lachnospiraceae bacterium]|nr:helix-turn-helix transcriptional regulator [Lachnospiraceae bacterium]